MATQASDTASSTSSKRGRGGSPDDLSVVAQRAQAFTNASGVAIALSEGNADEIVCRARSGASAPDVGAALRVEGTFTGLCIQSGKELRCDDCETDTRVDTAAIRALGIRSMVVTPIREDNRVIGVLAAFAPTPHAFTITHVAVLKTMGDQISVLLQKERRAREEQPQAEIPLPVPPTPVVAAKPAIVATPVPVMPPPVVIKPSSATPRAAAAAPAKVEPIKSMPVEVVPLAMPPRKEEKHADAAPRANFDTFDSVGEEGKSGNKFMLIGVVAVVVIAAAATFTFLKFQKSGPSSTQQHAQEPANAAAQPSAPASPATAQPASFGASAPAMTASGSTSAAPVSTATKPVVEIDARKASGKPSASDKTAAEKPAPAEKPATVATLSTSGPSRIGQQGTSQPTPEIAPSFNVSGNTAAPLSTLARPVGSAMPSAAAIEQSQLEPLQLLRTGQLIYPAIAKARNITGIVVVQVDVDKDGKVSNPKFISGPPIFRDAAFESVLQYKFKPAKLNGQAIAQTTQIRLNFH
jgi:TonB family protein